MNRFKSAAALALTIGIGLATGAAAAAQETPKAASAFVDSIGMDTHFEYRDTPYVQQFAHVKQLLLDAHVTHIREGAVPSKDALARDEELGQAGIKAIYVLSIKDTPEYVRSFPKNVPDSFEGYEGPNEYDRSGDGDWVARLHAFMTMLSTTVASDPSLAPFPVIGPSMTSRAAFAAYGDGTLSQTFGNMHDYPTDREPGQPTGYSSIHDNMAAAELTSGSKPIYATETGYCQSGGYPVPVPIAAVYEPRIFLEHFNRDVARVYQYEFLDDRPLPDRTFSHCGVVYYDGTPKPSYYALKSLTTLLEDSKRPAHLRSVPLALGGDTANVDHTLLQKSDGTTYLLLWLEKPSYDGRTKQIVEPAPQQVAVSIGAARNVRVGTFAPDGSLAMRGASAKDGSLAVTARDRVTVISWQP